LRPATTTRAPWRPAGWSERDRTALARLTRRFADDVFALVEAHDAPQPDE
jgi:hypothetical protein